MATGAGSQKTLALWWCPPGHRVPLAVRKRLNALDANLAGHSLTHYRVGDWPVPSRCDPLPFTFAFETGSLSVRFVRVRPRKSVVARRAAARRRTVVSCESRSR
jgi:hypothetical protein